MIIVKQLINGCSVDTAKELNSVHVIYVIMEKINQVVLNVKMEKLMA